MSASRGAATEITQHWALCCAEVGWRLPHRHGCTNRHPCHTSPKRSQKSPTVTHLGRRCNSSVPDVAQPPRKSAASPPSSGVCCLNLSVPNPHLTKTDLLSNRLGVCWNPGGSILLNHPLGQSKVCRIKWVFCATMTRLCHRQFDVTNRPTCRSRTGHNHLLC